MEEERGQQTAQQPQGEADARQEPDYKALWEAERANSRKWEGRAKEASSKALDEANARLAAEKGRREAVERVESRMGRI